MPIEASNGEVRFCDGSRHWRVIDEAFALAAEKVASGQPPVDGGNRVNAIYVSELWLKKGKALMMKTLMEGTVFGRLLEEETNG